MYKLGERGSLVFGLLTNEILQDSHSRDSIFCQTSLILDLWYVKGGCFEVILNNLLNCVSLTTSTTSDFLRDLKLGVLNAVDVRGYSVHDEVKQVDVAWD